MFENLIKLQFSKVLLTKVWNVIDYAHVKGLIIVVPQSGALLNSLGLLRQ